MHIYMSVDQFDKLELRHILTHTPNLKIETHNGDTYRISDQKSTDNDIIICTDNGRYIAVDVRNIGFITVPFSHYKNHIAMIHSVRQYLQAALQKSHPKKINRRVCVMDTNGTRLYANRIGLVNISGFDSEDNYCKIPLHQRICATHYIDPNGTTQKHTTATRFFYQYTAATKYGTDSVCLECDVDQNTVHATWELPNRDIVNTTHTIV